MTKELTVLLQAYVFDRASILPVFAQCLQAVFGDTGTWTCACISKAGIKKITSKKSIIDCLSKVREAIPQVFNQLEIVGKDWGWSSERQALSATIMFEPSPLNKDWAPVGEMIMTGHTRPILKRLHSFYAREEILEGKVKRDPVSISILLKYAMESKPSTRRVLLREFSGFIELMGSKFKKNYIGFIDPLECKSARTDVGPAVDRLDVRFNAPHMITFGPPAVVGKYGGDIAAKYPKFDLLIEDIGGCKVVALKDRRQQDLIELPKWHVYRSASWTFA